MSIWTHVAAVIRIDDLRVMTGNTLPKVLYRWQTLVPCGSEGELTVTGHENPHASSLSSFTITVHGDLRDFDSVQKVVGWLNERCSEMMGIRQGIGLIEVEGQVPVIWQYRRDPEKEEAHAPGD